MKTHELNPDWRIDDDGTWWQRRDPEQIEQEPPTPHPFYNEAIAFAIWVAASFALVCGFGFGLLVAKVGPWVAP
jgi:hypothetical protein